MRSMWDQVPAQYFYFNKIEQRQSNVGMLWIAHIQLVGLKDLPNFRMSKKLF